jgi:hypothetical protein
MSAFNDAAKKMSPGDYITCPFAFNGVDKEKLYLKLETVNEKGVHTFTVTWHGIFFGRLVGKADSSLSGWRFSDE